jgi:N-acetylglucosaminyl-diphospho-decaprenol L-rhamnosyltransferase
MLETTTAVPGSPPVSETLGSTTGGVALVIVNYRTHELALQCLNLIVTERSALRTLEVVLVDGGSGDDSVKIFRTQLADAERDGWLTILPLGINGGFGWANNQAIMHLMQRDVPPEFIGLMNPDAMVEPGAIARLIDIVQTHPDVGAVGSQLLESDGRPAGSAFRFPSVATEFFRGANTPALERVLGVLPVLVEMTSAGPVDWVTGASVMFRTAALRESGLFDDGFFLYFEEVELMHRLSLAGWAIWHEPSSRVKHIGGAATGVAGGGGINSRSMPGYWYQSRRRYFTRVYGSRAAFVANLAWLAGYALWRLRNMLGLGRAGSHAPSERSDLLHTGLTATVADTISAVVRWDDSLGAPPAWTQWE